MADKSENVSLYNSCEYNADEQRGQSSYDGYTISGYVAIYNIVMCCGTVPGNGLFFMALCADPLKCFRTPSSLLVMSMTFANLLTGLIVESLTAATSFAEQYNLTVHPVITFIHNAVLGIAPNASFFTLFALTLDSYIAASWPLKYKIIVRKKNVLICIFIIWTYIITFSLIQFTGVSKESYFKLDLYVNTIFIFVLLFASYVCLIKSLQANRKRALTLHPSQSACHVSWSNKVSEQRSRRSLTVVFILIVILTLTIVPNMVSWVLFLNCEACRTVDGFGKARIILRYLAYLKFLIDPFVYAWRMPRYRRAMRMTVMCQVC